MNTGSTATIQGTSAAVVSARAGAAGQTLDELMLAMDVVDTLRHQDNLVARELDESRREAELIGRLRQIYESQGLAVSDAILREGVAALKESRFVYTPPKPGLARTLALLWVRRAVYGRLLSILLVAAGLGWGGWYLVAERPRQQAQAALERDIADTLPRALEQGHRTASAEARGATAQARADQILADGRAALARRDVTAARAAVTELAALRDRLTQSYRLVVYSRPGQASGVWRVPPRQAADRRRNYYLIVEALGADGRPLSLPILNEEDGKTETVARWGVRVSETLYNAVARDKQDDGVIQNNLVGDKRRGELDVDFRLPVVPGATITRW